MDLHGFLTARSRALILTFILVMTSLVCSAQEHAMTLYGKVEDSKTGEALFFSSVTLTGSRISNISNSEGVFSIKIPADTPSSDKILISHLGYMSRSVMVAEFAAADAEHPLLIKLMPASIELDPATVRSVDAKSLFLSAFYKMKDNYPRENVGMTAFYREMIKKGANRYLVLNEAVMDVDKAPYTGYSTDKVGIYKGRGSINYESTDTLFVKLQGGVNTALQLDVMKNPFIGVEMIDATRFYDFTIAGAANIDDRSFIVVNFFTKPDRDDLLFHGSIYIDSESLAVGRIEFSMDVEGRGEEAAKEFIVKSSPGMTYSVTRVDYVINYKCFDGLWYYDYCRGDVSFSARKRRSLFKTSFSITEEMVMTDHRSGGIAIEPAARIRFKDILSDRIIDFQDSSFWEDYNIIEPDQSIDVIVKRIIRQLNRRGR